MTTIPARQQGVPAAFLPGPQPILPGGDDVYTQKEVERLTKATQKLYLMTAQAVTKAPTAPVDGVIRLARSPWWPVSGQTADAWVYYNAATQTWRYLSDTDAATATPLMDGTAAVGVSPFYARQDHVHPSDTSRAALAGSSSQVFNVANATTNSEAVAYQQVHGVQGGSLTWNPPATAGTYTNTVSFTAPCAGVVFTNFHVNNNGSAGTGTFSMEIAVNGSNVASDTLGAPSWALSATTVVPAGATTIVTTIGPSGNYQFYGRGNWLFIPTP